MFWGEKNWEELRRIAIGGICFERFFCFENHLYAIVSIGIFTHVSWGIVKSKCQSPYQKLVETEPDNRLQMKATYAFSFAKIFTGNSILLCRA